MSSRTEKLRIVCPCCQTTLVVDAKTGLVLHTEERKSVYSFEDAVEREKSRKNKADEMFEQAFTNEKKRQSALEDKFRQALESKDELEEPTRLFDLD